MSLYEGWSFFAILAVALVPALVLGYLQKPLHRYTFGLSVGMILLIYVRNPVGLAYFLFYLLWSVGLLYLYAFFRKKNGRKVLHYRLALILALAPLLAYKFSLLSGGGLFGFVGISYLTFRVVQMVIELYDGVIGEISFWPTISFLVFFPSLSSGPIDRSRRYTEDYHRVLPRQDYLELAGKGLEKLLLGSVYKFVLAAAAYKWLIYLDTPDAAVLQWAAYAYVYGIYLFFDFAGYSLMAIGTAYVLGVELPENFRAPFLAKDIRDFWERWHISLSHWFRDFIFTRLVMQMTKKKMLPDRLSRACVAFLINMGIMGLWHGFNGSYFAYGLYHGLLLSGNELYVKKSAFYKKNKNKPWYGIVSYVVTMQLVMLGFFIFSGKAAAVLFR